MSQYQPGRFALIIGAMDEQGRKMIGTSVQLIAFCPDNQHVIIGGEPFISMIGDAWVVLTSSGKYYLKKQANLMPIDDPTQFSDDAYGQAIQDMNKKKGKKDD